MTASKISEIEITPIRAQNGLVAFASVLLDNKVKLNSIGIYTKLSGGYRLTYPTKGQFNIFKPITKEVSQAIESAVLDKYSQLIGGFFDD